SLEGLRAAMSSPDEAVRDLTIQYLGQSPDQYDSAVQGHRIDLRDPELPEVLREQLRLTPPDRRDYRGYGVDAVPILASALMDKSARVSSHAAITLAGIQTRSLAALAALEDAALRSPFITTRKDALSALGSIGPEGRPAIRAALDDAAPEVRDHAKQVLESVATSRQSLGEKVRP